MSSAGREFDEWFQTWNRAHHDQNSASPRDARQRSDENLRAAFDALQLPPEPGSRRTAVRKLFHTMVRFLRTGVIE